MMCINFFRLRDFLKRSELEKLVMIATTKVINKKSNIKFIGVT